MRSPKRSSARATWRQKLGRGGTGNSTGSVAAGFGFGLAGAATVDFDSFGAPAAVLPRAATGVATLVDVGSSTAVVAIVGELGTSTTGAGEAGGGEGSSGTAAGSSA